MLYIIVLFFHGSFLINMHMHMYVTMHMHMYVTMHLSNDIYTYLAYHSCMLKDGKDDTDYII